jgi:serine/threonine protein kinase
MQPAQIEKIKHIIASALSKPPQEREAFLNDMCVGDPELRFQVDRYMHGGDKTEQFHYQAPTAPLGKISAENLSSTETVEVPGDARIGKTFGKYLIERRVAEGGMGIVYLALDTQLGREVALKILPEYFSMDRERLARFHREARATSLLNHPNIVTVFEIGHHEGCEYIVTEYVEGLTVRDLIRQGQVQFVEIVKIATQVASALAAAHKAGIVHRDIKPENVMLRPDGYVKVLDFGLAKLTDTTRRTGSGNIQFAPSGMNHTVPGMIMGTVSYMSPEQAEGLETDARTDIWALGALLYEMASGRVPFEGPTPSHTIVAILEQNPEPIDSISPELNQIILTALQKDKSLRFQTAESMAAALEDLRHRLGYVSDKNFVRPTSEQRSAATIPPKPRRYSKLLWLLPAAFVLLLIGTGALYAMMLWISSRSSSDPDQPPQNVNAVVPTPLPSIQSPTPLPTSTPTPAQIYVEPTPAQIPTPPPTATPDRRGPIAAPTPRPRDPKPRPTPRKRKPQDPNCVFTNTCT